MPFKNRSFLLFKANSLMFLQGFSILGSTSQRNAQLNMKRKMIKARLQVLGAKPFSTKV